MAMKNYYAILGVSRAETPAGIRAAYRDAVRRTHPDYAGPQSRDEFEQVVEAFSVLSDASRRRHYDRDLELSESDLSRSQIVRRFSTGLEPLSIFEHIFAVRP